MPSDPKCGWDRNGKSFRRPKLAPSGGEDQDCRESRWQVVGAAQETLCSKATLSKAIGRRLSISGRQRDLVAGFGWLTPWCQRKITDATEKKTMKTHVNGLNVKDSGLLIHSASGALIN